MEIKENKLTTRNSKTQKSHKIPISKKPGNAPSHEEIAVYAYVLYIANGKVSGRDMDDWLQAESTLFDASPGSVRSIS